MSHLAALRPLRLIPLDDARFLDDLDPRLDARLTTAIQYETTQRWRLALHSWYPRAEGLRYPSRHNVAEGRNYCLFLDRVQIDDLRWTSLGPLATLQQLVLYAADQCRLQSRLAWAPLSLKSPVG